MSSVENSKNSSAKHSAESLFGQALRGRREALGISQEELGFRAELHRTYVSQIERGLKSPSLGVILRLARALEVSAASLVGTVERAKR